MSGDMAVLLVNFISTYAGIVGKHVGCCIQPAECEGRRHLTQGAL